MASRNYTKTQAARIARRQMRQLYKMWDDDWISRAQWMQATSAIEKVFRHLKK